MPTTKKKQNPPNFVKLDVGEDDMMRVSCPFTQLSSIFAFSKLKVANFLPEGSKIFVYIVYSEISSGLDTNFSSIRWSGCCEFSAETKRD